MESADNRKRPSVWKTAQHNPNYAPSSLLCGQCSPDVFNRRWRPRWEAVRWGQCRCSWCWWCHRWQVVWRKPACRLEHHWHTSRIPRPRHWATRGVTRPFACSLFNQRKHNVSWSQACLQGSHHKPGQTADNWNEQEAQPELGGGHGMLHDPVRVLEGGGVVAHAVVQKGESEVDKEAGHYRHPMH